MYALVDCNNFYVSCEKLFNPSLAGKAIIVLSNNDGCAIARSEEAKGMGIDMGTPAFLLKEQIQTGKVIVFSSNYTLYGDISDRVMKTLETFVPNIELYSIDEAFLDMNGLNFHDLQKLGLDIRQTIGQHIGIPVTVGIAPTKTLAKMANRFAKKFNNEQGIYCADSPEQINVMLAQTGVENIWGIGRQYALYLKRNGFQTALEFLTAPEEWVKNNMTVVVQRLYNELKGVNTIAWETEPSPKKGICTSRSFGQLQTQKHAINEALVNYTANCALKLRQQNSCCGSLQVYLQTNSHRIHDRQYSRSIDIKLQTPSNITSELIKYASRGLDLIFREGYRYLKCGVVANEIIPSKSVQASMFDNENRGKHYALLEAMDGINSTLGKETVRQCIQGFERRYRLKSAYLSPKYTTDMNDILKVRI